MTTPSSPHTQIQVPYYKGLTQRMLMTHMSAHSTLSATGINVGRDIIVGEFYNQNWGYAAPTYDIIKSRTRRSHGYVSKAVSEMAKSREWVKSRGYRFGNAAQANRYYPILTQAEVEQINAKGAASAAKTRRTFTPVTIEWTTAEVLAEDADFFTETVARVLAADPTPPVFDVPPLVEYEDDDEYDVALDQADVQFLAEFYNENASTSSDTSVQRSVQTVPEVETPASPVAVLVTDPVTTTAPLDAVLSRVRAALPTALAPKLDAAPGDRLQTLREAVEALEAGGYDLVATVQAGVEHNRGREINNLAAWLTSVIRNSPQAPVAGAFAGMARESSFTEQQMGALTQEDYGVTGQPY